MVIENRHIDFKTLRDAYLEVKTFVETETFQKVGSISTRLVEDLGCSGDDNLELLEKFVAKYSLDPSGFDYLKHFHTEYELFGSEAALFNLINIPIRLTLSLIRILSFGKVKADEVEIKICERQVMDITVGDLVTWYLEKRYKLRDSIKYEIHAPQN